MRVEARIEHARHRAVFAEMLCDRSRARTLPVHADRQGLQTALRQVTVEWARDRTRRVLHETEVGGEIVVVGRYEPADNIRVTAQVLGARVHDGVRPE